jgi:hypothetical protein
VPFVDADHFGIGVHVVEQLARRSGVLRSDPHLAVRGDVIVAIAVVDLRFEDLHALLGDLGTAQPADELFALPAEHAAGDHFNPARRRTLLNVHASLG